MHLMSQRTIPTTKRKRESLLGSVGKGVRSARHRCDPLWASELEVRSDFPDLNDKLGAAFAKMFDDPAYRDPYEGFSSRLCMTFG